MISNIELGTWSPKLKIFVALAEALNLSPMYIYRKTGFLPQVLEGTASYRDMKQLHSQLTYEEQAELRELIKPKFSSQSLKRQKP